MLITFTIVDVYSFRNLLICYLFICFLKCQIIFQALCIVTMCFWEWWQSTIWFSFYTIPQSSLLHNSRRQNHIPRDVNEAKYSYRSYNPHNTWYIHKKLITTQQLCFDVSHSVMIQRTIIIRLFVYVCHALFRTYYLGIEITCWYYSAIITIKDCLSITDDEK